jgi:tetratricopeptide (TPR) repeat protein
MLERIAGALGAAHARGIVHRDVKPENVLLDASGRAFLADFGLAREDDADATVTQGFVGTPRYASPEQLAGGAVGPRADVFSFGLLAFELLAGRAAFAGEQATRFRSQRWPAELRLTKDLRAVVDRCLEKRPRDRYVDAREVALELARLRRLEPVQAVPRGPLARAWRRALLRPRRAAAVLLGIALAVGAVGGGVVAMRESAAAERTEARATLDRARDLIAAGRDEEARILLDPLLERGDVPAGAAGLRADVALHAGDAVRAAELYVAELGAGAPETADRVGLALTRRALGAEVALAGVGEPRIARDHAALALWHRDADPQRALAHLDEAVRLQPTAFAWRVERAQVLRASSRRVEAIEDLRLARDLRPDDLDAAHLLAVCLLELGRYAEMEELLRRVLQLQGEDAVLLADLAQAIPRNGGRDEEALAVARRAVEVADDVPHAWAVLGYALAWNGRHEEARAAIAAARERMPEVPELALASGWVALLGGDAARGEAEARALADAPRNWQIAGHELLGRILRDDRERRAEAASVYARLGELDPGKAEWPFWEGWALHQLGRIPDASQALARAAALDGERSDVRSLHGRLLLEEGRPQEALLELQAALGLDPEGVWIAYWLAMTWLELGLPEAGLVYVPVVQRGEPEWPWGWFLEGLLARESGDHERAVQAQRHMLAMQDVPAVRADMADSLFRLGCEVEALAEFRRAREDEPALATAWCGEAVVRLEATDAALRDPAEAVRFLERALALDPESAEYRALLERARAAAGDGAP